MIKKNFPKKGMSLFMLSSLRFQKRYVGKSLNTQGQLRVLLRLCKRKLLKVRHVLLGFDTLPTDIIFPYPYIFGVCPRSSELLESSSRAFR